MYEPNVVAVSSLPPTSRRRAATAAADENWMGVAVTITMRPVLDAETLDTSELVGCARPMRLVASVISKPSADLAWGVSTMPALLTRTSMTPYDLRARATKASIDTSEERSTISATAVGPSAATAAATRAASRPATMTCLACWRTASTQKA